MSCGKMCGMFRFAVGRRNFLLDDRGVYEYNSKELGG